MLQLLSPATPQFSPCIGQTDCYYPHCSQKNQSVFPNLADFHLSNSAAGRPEGQESSAELEGYRQKGNLHTSQRYPESIFPKLSPFVCSQVLCRAACSAPNIEPWQSLSSSSAGSQCIHDKRALSTSLQWPRTLIGWGKARESDSLIFQAW